MLGALPLRIPTPRKIAAIWFGPMMLLSGVICLDVGVTPLELVSIENSALTALFLATRPDGQPHLPRAFGELIKRYSFAGFPTKVEDLEATKITFRQGVFKDVGIASLDIYGDGVVITAKAPTDVLDAFLVDMCEWMETALGLKRVETHAINRAYESNVLVKSDAKFLKALDALRPVQDLVTKSVKDTTGVDAPYVPFGISLATDHAQIPSGLKPIAFRLERRATLAFDTNFYVSTAPLRTADHIKLLEKLEKMVA